MALNTFPNAEESFFKSIFKNVVLLRLYFMDYLNIFINLISKQQYAHTNTFLNFHKLLHENFGRQYSLN